ncbi:hypothetical protein F5B17DRAFT_382254 [Nemania serpens]|nr:hypothetical protein F5B17DRAFT_382254 [Nemania serpens]
MHLIPPLPTEISIMAPRVSETNLKFTMLSSKARKTQLGMLRRRRLTLFKKLNEYHRLSNAEVYTLIYVHGRFYEYSTTRRPHWPPAKDQIAQHYPLPVRLGPTTALETEEELDNSEQCSCQCSK